MNRIRTTIQKGPVIFSSIILALSIIVIVLFAIFDSKSSVALIVYIFCSIFILCAIPILADQLFHYLEIDDEYVTNHILFFKKRIRIKNIKEVILKKDVYLIFTKKGKKFGSFTSFDPLSGEFLFRFEKKGVLIK